MFLFATALLVFSGAAHAAEDPGQRARDLNQLQRRQQQDQLQLKMQQYQRSVQNPPADVRGRQAIDQLEVDQQLRQQQLHQRQQRELQVGPEMQSDDEGTRRAKAQIERRRAEAESRRQLQQFDLELQIQAAGGKPKEEGNRLPGAGTPVPGVHVPQ